MKTIVFPLYRFSGFHGYHYVQGTRDMSGNEYAFWYFLPFVVAIFFLIYKFFRNRNRVMNWENGRVPKNFGPSNKNIAEIYIVLAASATKRGKTLIKAKEKLISDYIGEHFPDVVCVVDESFDHAIWNPIDVPEIVFWCNAHLDAQQKLQLFEFLVVVVAIDGEVIPEELELIHYILNKFGIPFASLSDYAKKAIEVEESPKPKAESISVKQRMLSVLGLKDNPSLLEIKRTYRVLVKKLHPDRHPNATEKERTILVARFQELQEAYDYLLK